mmetsp:Transcript_20789/g.43444  ORF Transcript_20789/g.43444 Transcript_20789/m.43444 type:complete len:225 (-) Transcript_20789:37-711(-)
MIAFRIVLLLTLTLTLITSTSPLLVGRSTFVSSIVSAFPMSPLLLSSTIPQSTAPTTPTTTTTTSTYTSQPLPVKKPYIRYTLPLPSTSTPSNKPLQTHLHESTWSLPTGTVSVTLDPVRIKGLEEFGVIDVVAERVMEAERGRDGVEEVKLVGKEVLEGGYLLRYLSLGKRPKSITSLFTIIPSPADQVGGLLAVCQSTAKVGKDEMDELGGIVREFKIVDVE